MAEKKHWIAGAVAKHPGALRATAKRDGMLHGGGKITRTMLGKLAKSGDAKTKKRVALAKTLMSMHGH